MRVHHQVTCTVVLHIYIFFPPSHSFRCLKLWKVVALLFFFLPLLSFYCTQYSCFCLLLLLYFCKQSCPNVSFELCVATDVYQVVHMHTRASVVFYPPCAFMLAVPTVCFTTPEFFRLTICTYTWVVLCWHLVQSSRVKKKVPFFVKMCGGCISSACLTHAHMLLNEQH